MENRLKAAGTTSEPAKDEKFGLLAFVTLVEKPVVQRSEHHKRRRQWKLSRWLSQNLRA